MKRYRVLSFDFDLRIRNLIQLEDFYNTNPTPQLKEQIDQITEGLLYQYGQRRFEYKLQNLKEIGVKSLSIVAHHNILIQQIRESFINENYYPSITSACSLGERILNHLVLDLKEYFAETEDYEKLKNKKSNSNWNEMIKALTNWNILLPEVVQEFEKLKTLRHKSIHFNKNLTTDLRSVALECVNSIQTILFTQFSAFGDQPWFITSIPGETYLKQEWEKHPFIVKYYIPNCLLVGHKHRIINLRPIKVSDSNDYKISAITDEEFSILRKTEK